MREDDFIVTTDGASFTGLAESETSYEEVPVTMEEMPVRFDEVDEQIEKVSKKLTAQSIGWKIINTIGFLFISSLLFFLVSLIVTS